MPNILVLVPKHAFPGSARARLRQELHLAAAAAEQIPDRTPFRRLCWVLLQDIAPGDWSCGGEDLGASLLPCVAVVHLPAGVLDAAGRAAYVRGIHQAFTRAQLAEDPRPLATSVILNEVPDGCWGANGAIWRLPEFTRAAGFAHLQNLPAPG